MLDDIMFFFFKQEEDNRVVKDSRGSGEVYKRRCGSHEWEKKEVQQSS